MKGALAAACLALTPVALFAWPSVELEPAQDNTLYETAIDSGGTQNELSNGAGSFLFVGRTGFDGGFKRRRAVLKFDLAAVPPGAEILAAELTLYQSKAAPDSPPATLRLHRAAQEWGEGASAGIPPEGQGDFAETNLAFPVRPTTIHILPAQIELPVPVPEVALLCSVRRTKHNYTPDS